MFSVVVVVVVVVCDFFVHVSFHSAVISQMVQDVRFWYLSQCSGEFVPGSSMFAYTKYVCR